MFTSCAIFHLVACCLLVAVAKRVAFELDVDVGAEVGYQVLESNADHKHVCTTSTCELRNHADTRETCIQIRFSDVTSSKTKVKFMTDGCLLRECLDHKDVLFLFI